MAAGKEVERLLEANNSALRYYFSALLEQPICRFVESHKPKTDMVKKRWIDYQTLRRVRLPGVHGTQLYDCPITGFAIHHYEVGHVLANAITKPSFDLRLIAARSNWKDELKIADEATKLLEKLAGRTGRGGAARYELDAALRSLNRATLIVEAYRQPLPKIETENAGAAAEIVGLCLLVALFPEIPVPQLQKQVRRILVDYCGPLFRLLDHKGVFRKKGHETQKSKLMAQLRGARNWEPRSEKSPVCQGVYRALEFAHLTQALDTVLTYQSFKAEDDNDK